MPRSSHRVKKFHPSKSDFPHSYPVPRFAKNGLIDLHFHGAFGVDLVHATADDFFELARALYHAGISGFCPTVLSLSQERLHTVLERLGRASRELKEKFAKSPLATPLGIHLEGPFLNKEQSGAHPRSRLRRASIKELESLWRASQGELKRITLAPEIHAPPLLRSIVHWSRRRGVTLSMGHSRASVSEALHAWKLGIRGVTHAWNAMSFHHRNPGILGPLLGHPDTSIELIIDQAHVSPEVIDWCRRLHPNGLCYVSDCVGAAGLSSGGTSTLDDQVIRREGALCISNDGGICGSGLLLSEAFAQHLRRLELQSLERLGRGLSRTEWNLEWKRVTLFPKRALLSHF